MKIKVLVMKNQETRANSALTLHTFHGRTWPDPRNDSSIKSTKRVIKKQVPHTKWNWICIFNLCCNLSSFSIVLETCVVLPFQPKEEIFKFFLVFISTIWTSSSPFKQMKGHQNISSKNKSYGQVKRTNRCWRILNNWTLKLTLTFI